MFIWIGIVHELFADKFSIKWRFLLDFELQGQMRSVRIHPGTVMIQCSAFNVADTLFQLLSWFQRPQKPSDLDAIPPIPMSFFSSVVFACFGYGRGRYKTVCLLHISNQNGCLFITKLLFILFMFFVYPYIYIYIHVYLYIYIWQYGLAVLHRL